MSLQGRTERSVCHVGSYLFCGGGRDLRRCFHPEHQEVAEVPVAGAEEVRDLSFQQARRASLRDSRPQERPLRAPRPGAPAGRDREPQGSSLRFRELTSPSE